MSRILVPLAVAVALASSTPPAQTLPPCFPGICKVGPFAVRHCIVYADELQTECYYQSQGPGEYHIYKTFSSWNIWIGRAGVWTLHFAGDSATPVATRGDLPTIAGDTVRILFSCPPWGCRYLVDLGAVHQSGSAGFLYAGDKDALTSPI